MQKKRKKGLDILRAIAVILVLFRHSGLGEDNLLKFFGWLGVDLFFVLSGFLVSGLLFSEYKRLQTVDIKNFIIRRSFKIFPPFYFFLVVTLAFDYFVRSISYPIHRVVGELFYLQSYLPNIWLHTWTLAVEEQFYLAFAITMFFLARKHLLTNSKRFVTVMLILIIVAFAMRLDVSYSKIHKEFFSMKRTHLRIDGILMGVLLSYIYHFTSWTKRLLTRQKLLFSLSILLILPGFIFSGGSFVMNTIGLTTVNIGFAILVLLSLNIEEHLEGKLGKYLFFPIQILCFIGINSYSIYLWHLNAKGLIYDNLQLSAELLAVLYILLSLVLGILFSYLIEKSALKVRDKWSKNTN